MTLPAGLPEPTRPSSPGSASQSPTPGEQSAPGACAGCREHHPRLQGADGVWRHYRVSNSHPRGEYLVDCANPPKPPEAKHSEARRSAEECMKRIHELATKGSAVSVLVEARETFATHSQPAEREPGEDDE